MRIPPPKPPHGQTCNGCGLCCLAELCPIARLRYFKIAGPCPSLRWNQQDQRYLCGILANSGLFRPLIARWIAAGIGCDSPDNRHDSHTHKAVAK